MPFTPRSLRSIALLLFATILLETAQPGVLLAQETGGGGASSSSEESSSSSSEGSSFSSSSEESSSAESSIASSIESASSSSEDVSSSASSSSEDAASSSAESSSSEESSSVESSSSDSSSSSSEESSFSSASSSSSSTGSTILDGIDYGFMMHRMLEFRQGSPIVFPDGTQDTRYRLEMDLGQLKLAETQRMQALSVSSEAMERQMQTIDEIIVSLDEPLEPAMRAIRTPENPSAFEKAEDDTTLRTLGEADIEFLDLQEEWQPEASLLEQIVSFFFPKAQADPQQQLPVLADVQPDGKEIVFSDDIVALADSLDRNPVKIMNYVRSEIAFEPYSTSKKGAVGCLRDRVCNDVDTAALTISLLRASGIPARYRKAAALLTRAQAESLLGVDNPKSVYYALSANGRRTYLVGTNLPDPSTTPLELADLSSTTHFYTEWVGVEAFVEYDERAGNYNSWDDFSTALTDADVADVLQTSQKRTWIYLDPALQGTTRAAMPVPTGVDMLSFIQTHLTSADERTPVEHYDSLVDVSVTDPAARTVVTPSDIPYDILPPTPPYALGAKNDISTAAWSTLPDDFRQRVTVSLKNLANDTLLTKTIYAYEVQDQEFDIVYQGATPEDQAIVDSYGGIYATPPGLVHIVPVLSDSNIVVTGTVPVRIGETLILRFDVESRNLQQTLQSRVSEKFSIAGNNEGIYMTFSHAYFDPSRPAREDVLLGGNAAMARYYVAKLHEAQQQLSGVFDQITVSQFSRAVVTDNRLVTVTNGVPSTFDFRGLTIDAHSSITPTSRRTTFNLNSYATAVLLAAELSDYEAGVFEELAGLEGVSTVRGVKYAAARPQDYTVHVIDANSTGVIDTLQYSQNTRDNIAADVANGAKVITPNKPIVDEEFSGLVYASLGPSVLKFAIGEQSQMNGGLTKHKFTIVGLNVRVKKVTLVAQAGITDTIHMDEQFGPHAANCLVRRENGSPEWSILDLPGYDAQAHGYPCYKKTFNFGGRSHTAAITENSAYFEVGTSDSYWKPIKDIWSLMKTRVSQNPNGLNNPKLDGKQKFNTSAGTLTWAGHYTGGGSSEFTSLSCYWCLTVYYKPAATQPENAYTVYGSMLSKADRSFSNTSTKIIQKIGFPISNRYEGPITEQVTENATRYVQDFINGQMYAYKYPQTILIGPYFTYGKLTDEHRQNISTLGYPSSDPIQGIGGFFYQTYEDDAEDRPITKKWDGTQSSVDDIAYKKYGCELWNAVNQDGAGNDLKMAAIYLHGMIDVYASIVPDAIASANDIWAYIRDPLHALSGAASTAKELVRFFAKEESMYDLGISAWNATGNIANASYEEMIYATNCDARRAYLGGYFAGEVLPLLFPATAAIRNSSLVSKLQFLTQFKKIKTVSKIGEYGKVVKLTHQADIDELAKVRATTGSNAKGEGGELFIFKFLEADILSDRIAIPPNRTRIVDIRKDNLAIEVKTRDYIYLDAEVRDQIEKDVILRDSMGPDKYEPVWYFIDGAPSQPLKDALELNKIQYFIFNH